MIELPCKFHDYEILMVEVEQGVYECPICGAIALVRADPFWSSAERGDSLEIEWSSEPLRLKEVM